MVSSDPRGVDVDNGEEIVCSVGNSILCVTLSKVSLARFGGEYDYMRGYIDELLKCCIYDDYTLFYDHLSITAVILQSYEHICT